ncbi:hypothetical protein LguiA_036691 [Lonicera macranthoides]
MAVTSYKLKQIYVFDCRFVVTFGALSFIFEVVIDKLRSLSTRTYSFRSVRSPPAGVSSDQQLEQQLLGMVLLYASIHLIPLLFWVIDLSVAFLIACTVAGMGALLLWPTITEQLRLSHNVHHNMETSCATAKTGLVGGDAFVSLDSARFWLVSFMLADNACQRGLLL